jgi:hypothetical protein
MKMLVRFLKQTALQTVATVTTNSNKRKKRKEKFPTTFARVTARLDVILDTVKLPRSSSRLVSSSSSSRDSSFSS